MTMTTQAARVMSYLYEPVSQDRGGVRGNAPVASQSRKNFTFSTGSFSCRRHTQAYKTENENETRSGMLAT
mgnify:CR=1 FL=1